MNEPLEAVFNSKFSGVKVTTIGVLRHQILC